MTYKIWTKIVVASLILLGDSALASVISQRGDAEVVANSITVQLSQPDSLDDFAPIVQPFLSVANFLHHKDTHRYHTLTTLVDSNIYSSEYHLYNPRAPPLLSK